MPYDVSCISISARGHWQSPLHNYNHLCQRHHVRQCLYCIITIKHTSVERESDVRSMMFPLNSIYVVFVVHYSDVIMSAMAPQITSLTIVYSRVYPGADQRKHQRSASLAFVWGIHGWPLNSPHKWPVMRKMFPFYDVIMWAYQKKLSML